ncbi:MAG TPA: hypothetical protein DCY07_01630 [Rhodospirillaceae bacterium]|nr:hypothetical protein [Rhodospirillaceae bacterium]
MHKNTNIHFIRKRTLVWVCDIEKSSSILNDINYTNEAEEFLKRFFFISAALLRLTGGTVTKWTGDGFLAAYEIPLERDLGIKASKIISAAWHLTYLISTTQLGIVCSKKFRIRHGITYEPDAILVEQRSGHSKVLPKNTSKTMDIIGRGVVLAFRLAGIKAAFPSIVTQKKIIEATGSRERREAFRKVKFSHDDLLIHFKGEKWATSEIYASIEKIPKAKSALSMKRRVKKAIMKSAEATKRVKGHWLSSLYYEMAIGPRWARQVKNALTTFVEAEKLDAPKPAPAPDKKKRLIPKRQKR